MDNKIDLAAIKEERDLMLRTGLSIADRFINKKYLIDLSYLDWTSLSMMKTKISMTS